MGSQKKDWRNLSLSNVEHFKKEAGYKDFTKLNALRIASRIWISERGANLQNCVGKYKKPYVLAGYFLGALRIDTRANDLNLAFEKVKPNYLLFLAMKENMCGKEVERYQENFPPFIVKAQYVEPLVYAIRNALRNSEELRKFPWLITYKGKLGGRIFEAGILNEMPKISELKEFEAVEKFRKLIEDFSVQSENGVKIISPEDFDKAYREAFKELIENYEFVMQNLDKQENEPSEDDEDFGNILL